jgi:WD40 repeat protein
LTVIQIPRSRAIRSLGLSNCSATSPDNRLRLVVGDDIESLILDAETGRRVTGLRHHRDYGFACDWSPDGRYMATGNQDGTVQIWDARHWNHPLYTEMPFDKTIGTELGGIRSLHFSPLGGGKPVLLMAEPADVISIVDATTFDTRQRFDFFGEIGGTSFVPDGSAFFVANMDRTFGGLFQFERTTWQEPSHDRPFEPS